METDGAKEVKAITMGGAEQEGECKQKGADGLQSERNRGMHDVSGVQKEFKDRFLCSKLLRTDCTMPSRPRWGPIPTCCL